MNWADYSRFVGNVFGSLLAAEGVFAFFLEGGFLGPDAVRRQPARTAAVAVLDLHGRLRGALQRPLDRDGQLVDADPGRATRSSATRRRRAVMTNFWEVVFTPSFIPRIMHVFVASWTVGRRPDAERQRVVPAQETPRRAGQVEPQGRACRCSSCSRRLNVVIFGANHGGRGDREPAAQAGLDGRALPERVVCPDVRRGLGRRDHADDDRDLDPVPSELPGVPGHPCHGRGHRCLRPGPDPADQPRVPGLSLHDHDGTRPGRDRSAGRADVPLEAAALRVALRALAAGAHGLHR